jgi:hypothetical protein
MISIPGDKGNENQSHVKIPTHSFKNSYHTEHKQQQMLAWIWGKKEPSYTAGGKCKLVQP